MQVLKNRLRSREKKEAIEQIAILEVEKYCINIKISVVLVAIIRIIVRFFELNNKRENS